MLISSSKNPSCTVEIEVFEKKDLDCIQDLEPDKITGLNLILHKKFSLKYLKYFPDLKHLLIGGTASGYDAITECRLLETLHLSGLVLSDLNFLTALSLKNLSLEQIKTKQSGLYLPPMPELESLYIAETARLSDLSNILTIPSLKKLILYRQNIKELPNLSSFEHLKLLTIMECTKVKSLENIKTATSLEVLNLINITLRPADIEAIASIKSLRKLGLSEITFKSNVVLTNFLNQSGLSHLLATQ